MFQTKTHRPLIGHKHFPMERTRANLGPTATISKVIIREAEVIIREGSRITIGRIQEGSKSRITTVGIIREGSKGRITTVGRIQEGIKSRITTVGIIREGSKGRITTVAR